MKCRLVRPSSTVPLLLLDTRQSAGMLPPRLLALKFRYAAFARPSQEDGSVPVSLLSLTSTVLRAVRLPQPSGTPPAFGNGSCTAAYHLFIYLAHQQQHATQVNSVLIATKHLHGCQVFSQAATQSGRNLCLLFYTLPQMFVLY